MRAVGKGLARALSQVPGYDEQKARKAMRAVRVRDVWAGLVNDTILAHTNAVFVFDDKGRRMMHVYVDESIYAAAIDTRREILVMRCRRDFGEEVEGLAVHVSRGKWKQQQPYADRLGGRSPQVPVPPLSDSEQEAVERSVDSIKDPHLSRAFKKAMEADLRWKKALQG